MIPWQVRAGAAFATGVLAQVMRAHGRPARVLPLLTARRAGEDPPPELVTSHGQDGARIAVVIHSHFAEVLPGLLAALDAIPEPYDLLVTTTAVRADVSTTPGAASVRVFHVENRGRDILPLVRLVNAGLLDGYGLVCKIHTKRSTWRAAGGRFEGDGNAWRDALVTGLLGSRQLVGSILRAFEVEPSLTMVTAPGQVLGPPHWGANLPLVLALGRRGGLPVVPGRLRFAAGSMYWVRGDALRRLRDLGLRSAHFDAECGQDDGTTAHAVERYLGYLVADVGGLVTSDALAP
ncbi:MAG: hypothetical protein EOL89_10210 [Actinobacteria bacterium]|nr:hypothetical protein [Actinomycetota bacterium]